jgi:tripartite-type tricarboxylate transporter receptor subunit TctC
MKPLFIAGLSLFIVQSTLAQEQPAASFFTDKTLTVLIPTPPGGGYDLYARLYARHIGTHIPGRPNVVAQNRPGASGFVMAQWLYNGAPKDGLTVGMPPQNAPTEEVLGNPAARFNSAEFGWIGRLNSNIPTHYLWHTHPARSIEDAKKYEILSGADAPMSTQGLPPKLMNVLIGTKFKVVSGYGGGAKVRLAVEGGELHAGVAPAALLRSELADWLSGGKIRLLVQYGPKRHPSFPETPAAPELAGNDDDRRVIDFLVSDSAVGRSIAAPPGVLETRVSILRLSFERMISDSTFISEALKRNIEIDPLSGEELQRLVSEMISLPPPIAERARSIVKALQHTQ